MLIANEEIICFPLLRPICSSVLVLFHHHTIEHWVYSRKSAHVTCCTNIAPSATFVKRRFPSGSPILIVRTLCGSIRTGHHADAGQVWL